TDFDNDFPSIQEPSKLKCLEMSRKEICTYAQNDINSKQQHIADFFSNKHPDIGIGCSKIVKILRKTLNRWVEQVSASAVVLIEQLIKEKKMISIFQMDGSKSLRKEIN
ncbi:3592_t:CDS:2, partial [Entrophospora sp. SA101]